MINTTTMKKLSLLTASLLCLVLSFSSCKKDKNDSQSSITVEYKMLGSLQVTGQTQPSIISSCFHYNLSYVNDQGQTVTLNNVSAPWSIAPFEVKSPFTARIEGIIIYNENELPDGPIEFGALPNINYIKNGTTINKNDNNINHFSSKSQFLEFIATHPDRLKFKVEVNL